MLQTIIACAIAALLAALLYRNWRGVERKRQAMPEQVLGSLRAVIDNAEISHGEAAGVYRLAGSYLGRPVAIKVVTDLLMLRKLPSLWLMVTLPGEVAVPGTLDVMWRPAGQSSFSNFDFLPLTFPAPAGFPEGAVIRGDDAAMARYIETLAGNTRLLALPGIKEILVTPKGIRLVTLLAEGERARYGVYRQAEFGDACASGHAVREHLDFMIKLKADLSQ